MALDPKSKKDVQDTASYIEDTLRSVSAKIGEALKDAVEQAFDSVEATVLSTAMKDFTRSMNAAARASEDLVKNTYRVSEGLLKSRDIDKQIAALAERRLATERKFLYTKQLAEDVGKSLSKQDIAAFKDANKAFDLQQKMLQIDQQRVKEVDKSVGLTGKLVGALTKIPGLGQFIQADEIEIAMRKAAAAGKGTFKTMGIAAGMIGKQLLAGLSDPLTYVLAIWNGFLNVNKAGVEFQRLTGKSGTIVAGLNSQLATSVDVLQVMAEVTKQVGMSATSIFSPDDLGRLAQAKNLLGISAEQATNLGIRSKIAGEGIRDYQKGIVAATNKYNGLKGTTIAHGVVMQDVLSTSDDIALSLGGSSDRIAEAATSARSLGLNLEKVDQIAGTLMNFEDSISNELEAQLLTGKDINLSKAREYALNNNLVGLSEELKKNGASAAEFANMGRIEQESLAKALGMSRSELAKSIMMGETAKNLTAEQKAEAMGVTLEQMEQMDIQQRLQKSLDKLAQAFAPILEGLVPVVEIIGAILNPIAAAIAGVAGYLAPIMKVLTPIVTAFTVIYGLVQAWALTSAVIAGYEALTLGYQVAQASAKAGTLSTQAAINMLKGEELVTQIGIAAAWAIANPFTALAGIAIAAGIGGLIYSQMKDGVIDPKKGPVVSGEFGSVQLHPNDQVAAGTDLFGTSKGSSSLGSAVGNTQESTLAGVEAKLQELINVARQGTVVQIDGKEIARTVIKNTKTQAQSLS